MKLPIYFEAYGSVGITVSFVAKTKRVGKPYHGTISMLLAECPDEMRQAVNNNGKHFEDKISGYELKDGKYILSRPIGV